MMMDSPSFRRSGGIVEKRGWLRRVVAATPLSMPGFPVLLMGQAVALQGTWIQGTAQRWFMLELTGSPWMVGVLGAVGGIPILLFAFAGGWLADRLPRISVLVACQFLIALQGLLLGLLVQWGNALPSHLLAFGFVLGCAMAAEVPARQALVFDLVGRRFITNALGLHSTAFNMARFAGPAFAGWLMAAGLLEWCFYLRAITALFVISCLLYIRFRVGSAQGERRAPPSLIAALRGSFSCVVSNPALLWVMGIILAFGVLLLPYSILLPSLGKDVLGLGPEEYGYLCSSNGLGALAGAVSVAALGQKGRRIDWWKAGTILFPLSLVATGLSTGYHQAMACLFLSGAVMVITSTSALSLIQLEAPDGLRGQLMGLFTTSFMGLFPLGSLLQGWLAEQAGVRESMILCAASAFFLSVAAWMRFRQVQQ